ncbi:uncharacterized protein LOC104916024, partial [Meleagris gallopavo]|uniref:uncharacterized protein LOC104916024 n=1 Tax=Meleagris gallopavo TaxID=9103 RepID=UPI00093AB22A
MPLPLQLLWAAVRVPHRHHRHLPLVLQHHGGCGGSGRHHHQLQLHRGVGGPTVGSVPRVWGALPEGDRENLRQRPQLQGGEDPRRRDRRRRDPPGRHHHQRRRPQCHRRDFWGHRSPGGETPPDREQPGELPAKRLWVTHPNGPIWPHTALYGPIWPHVALYRPPITPNRSQPPTGGTHWYELDADFWESPDGFVYSNSTA